MCGDIGVDVGALLGLGVATKLDVGREELPLLHGPG